MAIRRESFPHPIAPPRTPTPDTRNYRQYKTRGIQSKPIIRQAPPLTIPNPNKPRGRGMPRIPSTGAPW